MLFDNHRCYLTEREAELNQYGRMSLLEHLSWLRRITRRA